MTFYKLDVLEQNSVGGFDIIVTYANLPQDKHKMCVIKQFLVKGTWMVGIVYLSRKQSQAASAQICTGSVPRCSRWYCGMRGDFIGSYSEYDEQVGPDTIKALVRLRTFLWDLFIFYALSLMRILSCSLSSTMLNTWYKCSMYMFFVNYLILPFSFLISNNQ